jgi:hypothetical protein
MPEDRVPRPFQMHWGGGEIIEEARFEGEHTAPAIQLMRFDDGEAAGTLLLRFCHFSHDGRFQRSPMMLAEAEIEQLRAAVRRTPFDKVMR